MCGTARVSICGGPVVGNTCGQALETSVLQQLAHATKSRVPRRGISVAVEVGVVAVTSLSAAAAFETGQGAASTRATQKGMP